MIKSFLEKLKALFDGHFIVFKHSFKKRVTLEYPEKKSELSEVFRGKHKWHSDKCLGCKVCEKVCPAGAIKIEKFEDKLSCKIDYKKCIFCGNCKYYCKKEAISMQKEYELATDNKNDLIVEYNSTDSEAL